MVCHRRKFAWNVILRFSLEPKKRSAEDGSKLYRNNKKVALHVHHDELIDEMSEPYGHAIEKDVWLRLQCTVKYGESRQG
jgi:hypothetical protein